MFVRILCAIFIFICGSDVYGFEFKNSKLTVSPDCGGGIFKDTINTLPWLKVGSNAGGISTSTNATVYPSKGKIDRIVRLKTIHNFSVCNGTDKVTEFNVAMKLSSHDGQYTEIERTFSLNANESMNISTELYLSKEYLQAEDFEVYASTIVSGDISCSDSDINVVVIR